MLDRTGEWCFEGGCTYTNMAQADNMLAHDADMEELEALYCEPCFGKYD